MSKGSLALEVKDSKFLILHSFRIPLTLIEIGKNEKLKHYLGQSEFPMFPPKLESMLLSWCWNMLFWSNDPP